MTQIARQTAFALALVLILGAVPATASSGVVNVNTASLDELTLLPRVGPSVAQRIIELREANGSFKSAEDLMLVRGIGERTFELLEPYVTVSGETTLREKVRVPRDQQPEDQR